MRLSSPKGFYKYKGIYIEHSHYGSLELVRRKDLEPLAYSSTSLRKWQLLTKFARLHKTEKQLYKIKAY